MDALRLSATSPLENWGRYLIALPALQFLKKLDWLRALYGTLLTWVYPNGIEWNINGTDPMYLSARIRAIAEEQEPEAWTVIMDELKPGDTFADIGANIGLYSIAVAKRLNNTGRVISFEPDTKNYSLLKENLRLNNLHNQVIACLSAVGSSMKNVPMETGQGPFSKVRSSEFAYDTYCTILDKTLKSRRLDILKIDVEGFEKEVLFGAQQLLADKNRGPRLIYLELHPWAWNTTRKEVYCSELADLLTDHGYSLFTVDQTPLGTLIGQDAVFARRSQ